MTDFTNTDEERSLAEAVAKTMLSRSAACKLLGLELIGVAPGFSKLALRVREEMLNGHQICHGGFIFSLADSAFALACNSYNFVTVGAGCSIEYLVPARAGDVLTAEAVEQTRSGKTGIYDVSVTNQDGTRVALFRGKSHQIKGEVLASLAH